MPVDFQVCLQPHVLERFWAKVQRGDPNECWPWLGAVDRDGYGVFGLSSRVKSVRAPRFAYLITKGDPGDLLVLHTCDNPRCCNPRCLTLGTALANMQDKVAKGRHRSGTQGRPDLAARGELHGNALLTEAQVARIRREYIPRRVPLRQFAEEFGVSVSAIHYALKVGWRSPEKHKCP